MHKRFPVLTQFKRYSIQSQEYYFFIKVSKVEQRMSGVYCLIIILLKEKSRKMWKKSIKKTWLYYVGNAKENADLMKKKL